MEVLGNIFNTIVSVPGALIGTAAFIIGAGGILLLAKKALDESIQAISKIKAYIVKYKTILTTGQGAADFKAMVKEVDEALESYAAILAKLQLKGLAKKLRDLIKE